MKPQISIGLAVATALAIGVAPSAASADSPPKYEIDQAQVQAEIDDVVKATGQDVMSGEIAGAAWIAQVPENWNGDLVIYAHGYRGEGTDLTVDAPPAFEFLTSQGYAWAASSYRRNSYDPGIGVTDTKNLTRHMQEMLRHDENVELDKTYLVGFSMGGHVTAAAIERYPNLWDGALPACGVLGDVELFDYFLDYNFGAAAIAGASDFNYPSNTWIDDTVDPTIKPGLSSVGASPTWAYSLTSAGERFKDFVEIGSGGERATFDVAWNYWHAPVEDLGFGNFFFDLGQGDGTIANRSGRVSQNSDMSYADEYGPQFADLDDTIARTTASNRVRKSQGSKPAVLINGTPSIPVLTIHTTGDLFVPIEMEQIYAREVAANGRSDLLVQRAIRDVGHCSFTGDELIESYTDLFTWVETGIRPVGEDLIADIGESDLGCDWTKGVDGSGLRPVLALVEPCL